MAAHSTNGYQAHSRTNSTPASTSTLRPRVGRLISGLDEDTFTEIKTTGTGRAASPRGTPGTSRPVSPVPVRHPSRTNPSDRTFGVGQSPKVRRDQSTGGFTSLLGSSWTSIQGLASTVLSGTGSATPPGGSSPRRNPRDIRRPHTRAATSEPPQKWGSTQYKAPIGIGSDQERAALVREAKRKDLLAADGQIAQDVLGRHKRRQSDDVTNHVVQEQEEQDALIYVHNVKLGDNIAGLALRYHCSQAAIRKANRLWTNDSIQSRKTVILPVDDCGIKGRRVESWGHDLAGASEDLLGDDPVMNHESPASTPQFAHGWEMSREPSIQSSSASKTLASDAGISSNGTAEVAWRHESWVQLPNFVEKTEIARLPRKALGFFPRTRRKSVAFSDFSTPKASLDVPRSSAASPRASPALRPTPNRTRSSSRAQAFANLLQGPGGVGTLDRTVRLPGPASDSFNEILGPHLPDVRPPTSQTAFTPWYPAYFDTNGEIIGGGGSPSAFSIVNAHNTKQGGMDFQEIGNAIETWMRKTAKKAASALDNGKVVGGSGGTPLAKASDVPGGPSGLSDLIELVDSVDLNDGFTMPPAANRGHVSVEESMRVNKLPVDGIRGRRAARLDDGKDKKAD